MALSALPYSLAVKPCFLYPHMDQTLLSSLCVVRRRVSFISPSLPTLRNQSSALNLKGERRLITCSLESGAEGVEKEIRPIENSSTFPTVMDINDIQEFLQHRYPFLLVDRVVEHHPGVSIVGIKHLTMNESFFSGHFPGNPTMPGVLIIDAMAQVASIGLMQPEVGFLHKKFLLLGVDKVRFRKQVIPGDTLVMRVTLLKVQRKHGYAKAKAKAYVGGVLVCEAELMGVGEISTC